MVVYVFFFLLVNLFVELIFNKMRMFKLVVNIIIVFFNVLKL